MTRPQDHIPTSCVSHLPTKTQHNYHRQRIVEVLKIYYYETKHAINTYLKTTSDSCTH